MELESSLQLIRFLTYSYRTRTLLSAHPLISTYSLLGGGFFGLISALIKRARTEMLAPPKLLHGQSKQSCPVFCGQSPHIIIIDPPCLVETSTCPTIMPAFSNDTAKISCSLSSSSLTDKTSPKVRLLLTRVSRHS